MPKFSPWSGCPYGQYPQCPYLRANMCKHCAEKGTLACIMTKSDSHTLRMLCHVSVCIREIMTQHTRNWILISLLPSFYNDPSLDFDLTQQTERWLLVMMPRLLPSFVCAESPHLIEACAETLGRIASVGVCHASDYGRKLSKIGDRL